MAEVQETVLVCWARDADGGAERFTGDAIYARAGVWCMDRLRRDIPTISTFYCRTGRLYFTVSLAVVPERAVPVLLRLRRPDEVTIRARDSDKPWALLAYKTFEDA